MKSRQVGLVLMALIAVGLAGLIIRLVSAGSDELVLSGLLPISQEAVDRVVISSGDKRAELVKVGDTWRVGNIPAFVPKLNQFWAAVNNIDGAQLIAQNPTNHARMGVAQGQGTEVEFYLGPGLQAEFFLGKWTPDVRLCYLRRPARNEVYGIPCQAADIFDPDPDGWRDPVIVSIPRAEIASITFTYPQEPEFTLTTSEGEWVVVSGAEERPADLANLSAVLGTLELLLADGFATQDEERNLKWDSPNASIRITTSRGASVPTTRLWFLRRQDGSYYLRNPAQPTVFVVSANIAQNLLKKQADLTSRE